ncbi:D-alanine transaminase [Biostraticola tofi]|uniref:Aminodeoxychorismate lyase n=2 Tax=Biostraticola tofi TaxID=466109 RepID=A0A4R3Z065_9GAMM|nr:D-alanine transaminase [Biostraticola tofi]
MLMVGAGLIDGCGVILSAIEVIFKGNYMSRTVYVNGSYVAEQDAKISIFDRGFLFGDAIYEVTAVLNGRLVDNPGHLARLERSCGELGLVLPIRQDQLVAIQHKLIDINQLQEGSVYIQLSRGTDGDRDFHFPQPSVQATLVVFTQARKLVDNSQARNGIRVVTLDDIRWQRRDIKVVALLAACLAKQQAQSLGADDAFLVAEDGTITEGSSCNAFIIDKQGHIITRPLGRDLLHGITRRALLELADQQGIVLEERPFTREEAYQAAEAFITSATSFVWPVTHIDGHRLGDGAPGPMTRRLQQLYHAVAAGAAEPPPS